MNAGNLLNITKIVGVQTVQIVIHNDVIGAGIFTDDADTQRGIAPGVFLTGDQHIERDIQVADQPITHRLRCLCDVAEAQQQG
ncbi:hypothetical protein D3C75_1045040 [compost metagenome]